MRNDMKLPARKTTYGLAAIAALALLALMFRPTPLRVDTGQVQKGSMQVTIDEQGETRAQERFVITAPVAGRLTRVELHDGDAVQKNQVVAQIAPLPLSVRERNEQTARIASAQSQQREAEEQVRHAVEDLAQAKRERIRVERLVKDGFMSAQAAEHARNAEITIANDLEAARFRAKSAAAEVRLAKSGLIAVQGGKDALFKVHSPVAGHILRIVDPSERVVAAGAPLMTLGDLGKLEVVIELLSTEAVKVRPGMKVILDGWGGSQSLNATVQRVEPHAFTKVSALGIEEKRTNVIADFVDAPKALGDGYRVNAHIVVWAADNVTKVPASALFRCGEAWCAFAVENGRAKKRTLKIGHSNAQEAEVLEGLKPGETVIRHPANQIEEGARVATG
jgi:HlyD family secretion protein